MLPVWPGERNYKGIGPSHLSTFASCAQRAAFNYELRLEPLDDPRRDPAKVGDLIHAALAYHYGAMLSQRPGWMVYGGPQEAIYALASDRSDLAWEAWRIFSWYLHYYQNDSFRPIAVENQLNVKLEDEWLSVRMDLLAYEGSDLVVVDHKSKKTLPRNTGQILSTDRQMLMLLGILRANGHDVRRVIVNGMTRDFPEPRFRRFSVPISEAAYERLATDTLYYLRMRRQTRQQFPDPYFRPRNFDACMTRYGLCPFDGLCRDGFHRLEEFAQK